MESYEYKLLAQMIATAKKRIPFSVPLHLFGAGHPLTIPFAVALGCDTFDSASYMLYAKKERYITEDGTRHLSDISVFPCNCEVCSNYTPKELMQLNGEEKVNEIALHNLHAIKLEVDKVKQSIYEGRLWEYVLKKTRAHPKLFEIKGILTKNSKSFEISTPKFKEKAIFLFDKDDQYRPEVSSFHAMVRKFRSRKNLLIIIKEPQIKPGYLSREYLSLKRKFKEIDSFQICYYNPQLGLIPNEISDIFPAAHHETARVDFNSSEFVEFEKTWIIFFENNKFNEVFFDKKDEFLKRFIKKLPKEIKRKSLS